jgi:hypothetical protein
LIYYSAKGGQVFGFPLTTCGNDPSSLTLRRAGRPRSGLRS